MTCVNRWLARNVTGIEGFNPRRSQAWQWKTPSCGIMPQTWWALWIQRIFIKHGNFWSSASVFFLSLVHLFNEYHRKYIYHQFSRQPAGPCTIFAQTRAGNSPHAHNCWPLAHRSAQKRGGKGPRNPIEELPPRSSDVVMAHGSLKKWRHGWKKNAKVICMESGWIQNANVSVWSFWHLEAQPPGHLQPLSKWCKSATTAPAIAATGGMGRHFWQVTPDFDSDIAHFGNISRISSCAVPLRRNCRGRFTKDVARSSTTARRASRIAWQKVLGKSFRPCSM